MGLKDTPNVFLQKKKYELHLNSIEKCQSVQPALEKKGFHDPTRLGLIPPVRDSQYTRYKAFGNSYCKEAYFFNPGFPKLSTDISFF